MSSQDDTDFENTPRKSAVPEPPLEIDFGVDFFDAEPSEFDLSDSNGGNIGPDHTPIHNNPETPEQKQIVQSSPLGAELGGRQARYVYLITYSQADMERFPSPLIFSLAITSAFEKCNVAFDRWVCSKEKHPNTDGYHYHMAIQLPRQSRWKKIKNQIQKDSDIVVHFSAKHAGYKLAYHYVCKCARGCDILKSENHVYMGAIREDDPIVKCMMANAKKGRDSEKTRQPDSDSKKSDSQPSSSSKRKLISKDLRHKDVTKLIIEQRIGSLKQLQAMAELRRQGGEYDLFNYLAVHPSNKTEEMIARVWEITAAPSVVNQVPLPRITILQNAALSQCVPDCNGRWIKFAEEIVNQNPLVNAVELKKGIQMNIELGRAKGSTIFLIGPKDCGKSFLLIMPLEKIFKTFSNPTRGRYNWIGVDEKEVIYLNDFRWDKDVIPWEDFLRLLAGERVWFERPKNQFATNIFISEENTIPVFGTGMTKYQWMGAYQATNQEENAQMDCRITYFYFTFSIPPHKIVRRVSPCPSCFGKFILH